MYATHLRFARPAIAILLSSIVLFAAILVHCPAGAASASGGQWVLVPSGTSSSLSGVFGAASFASAVGANGVFLVYDGVAWNPLNTPTTQTLNAVWGVSRDNILAVGDAGNILHFDGRTVSKMPYVTSANLRSVWARSRLDAYAVGDNGTILRFEGAKWLREQSGTAMVLRDVYGRPDVGVLAVGNSGTIVRFDGTSWLVESTPTTANLYGVWMSRAQGFAVGNGGTILHHRGFGWELMPSPTSANLTAVWGLSDSRVYAVGDNGVLLSFDGVRWSLAHLETASRLNGIDNGFVVGANGTVFRNTTLHYEVDNLRITEVDPVTGEVEVTNQGPAFVSGAHSFCDLLDCDSSIPSGTEFFAEEIKVFSVPGLDTRNSDLWLFRTMPFTDPDNLVHGTQYGSKPALGHTAVAVAAGKWPDLAAVTPPAPSRMTIAYDGYGLDPKDWYIDETPTMGVADFTPVGTIPNSLTTLTGEQNAGGFVLSGEENFENVPLGDEVDVLAGWQIANTSTLTGIFTARVVNDVDGAVSPRDGSTRWVRIRDEDGGAVRNEVASPVIATVPGEIVGYSWSFWLNIEEAPTPGLAHAAFMVEHAGDDFEAVWGIEIRPDDICLVVTPSGGKADSQCLLGTPPPVGEWLEVTVNTHLDSREVEAAINGAVAGVLPISPAADLSENEFRLAYRGGGLGNVGTTILDDLTVELVPTTVPVVLNAAATVVGDGVRVSWSVYGEPATTFTVYRRTDNLPEEPVAGPLGADARQFVDATVPVGHTYHYVVGATKDDGTEVRSRPAQVEIEAPAPAKFKSLHASSIDDAIAITWDIEINGAVTGFRVYRQSSVNPKETELTSASLLPVGTRRFDDTDVRKGQWYSHVIAAVTADGAEVRSKQTFVEIPKPPLEITRVFPNPFSGSTSLDFSLADAGWVSVNVYDVQGKYVATITERARSEGPHTVSWDGRDNNGHAVSAGAYFFKLQTRGAVLTRKIVLVR